MSRGPASEALRRFTWQTHLGMLACLLGANGAAAEPAKEPDTSDETAATAGAGSVNTPGANAETDAPGHETAIETPEPRAFDPEAPTRETASESTANPSAANPEDPTTALCISKHADGQEARMEQRLLDSALAFGSCAAAECPGLVREDCLQWRTQVLASAPRVVFQAPEGELGGLQIWVNGQLMTLTFGEPMIFDPGRHDLRFEAPGRASVTRQLQLRAGAAPTIVEIELPAPKPARPKLRLPPSDAMLAPPAPRAPPPESSMMPSLVYVFGGVAAGALGVGTYFAIDGESERAHAESECAPLCEDRDVASIDRKLLIADVALGVSLVSAATALALYVLDNDRDRRRRSGPSVALALEPEDLSVTLGGKF